MVVLVGGAGLICLALVAYGVYYLLKANSEIDYAISGRRAKRYNKLLVKSNEGLRQENDRYRDILDEICSYRNSSKPGVALHEVVTLADKARNNE